MAELGQLDQTLHYLEVLPSARFAQVVVRYEPTSNVTTKTKSLNMKFGFNEIPEPSVGLVLGGLVVGLSDGTLLGLTVGLVLGDLVGDIEGERLGLAVGLVDGKAVAPSSTSEHFTKHRVSLYAEVSDTRSKLSEKFAS